MFFVRLIRKKSGFLLVRVVSLLPPYRGVSIGPLLPNKEVPKFRQKDFPLLPSLLPDRIIKRFPLKRTPLGGVFLECLGRG